jgi:hypothetical protein
MFDIAAGAGEEIVHAKNFMAPRQQRFTEKGSDKTRSAGHQNALFQVPPP